MAMDIVEVVKLAQAYLDQFPDLFPGHSIRLEEVEVTDGGRWLVTLSFLLPSDESGALPGSVLPGRSYKSFEIDLDTKSVIAMRIRNPLIAA